LEDLINSIPYTAKSVENNKPKYSLLTGTTWQSFEAILIL